MVHYQARSITNVRNFSQNRIGLFATGTNAENGLPQS